jgi:Tfp pilus assembly protein PilV
MKRFGREGVSLVELIVAILILTMGILGLAAGTSWSIRAIDLAELDTKRSAALQAAIERVRAMPYSSLAPGSQTEGNFLIGWTITGSTQTSTTLQFVLVGPGRAPGGAGPNPEISPAAADTLVYTFYLE